MNTFQTAFLRLVINVNLRHICTVLPTIYNVYNLMGKNRQKILKGENSNAGRN
jgi:hypothetical protein